MLSTYTYTIFSFSSLTPYSISSNYERNEKLTTSKDATYNVVADLDLLGFALAALCLLVLEDLLELVQVSCAHVDG